MRKYQLFIDGAFCDPRSDVWFETIEPFSGEPWALIPRGGAEDAAIAVAAAERAFRSPQWAGLTPTARAALMRRLADLVDANAERLADIERRDNGKRAVEVLPQVRSVAQWLHYYAGLADKVEGAIIPNSRPGLFCYTLHEPLGVVLAITPWNSPLTLTTWKLAPALAAGNTIVIKPSEFTSASVLELAELSVQAGFPPGVINVVTGFGPEVGEPLVRDPRIAKIAMTGGEESGRRINQLAAADFKSVTLELGGKSPNIVFEDADLEEALKGAIAGVFGASGQTCVAGSRLLLQASIHDRFVERLVDVVSKARAGDPADPATEIAPIATRPQWTKILSLIEAAKAEGAHCATGGHALSGAGYGQGQFIAPTVFTGVKNHMRIAQEEVFGPVLSVVRFEDEEEAIRIANDVRFGLAAGVWTRDLARALRCASRLQAGTVWVNNYRATSFSMPFGGYKQSGVGREGGVEAIKEYLQTKSVWITPEPSRSGPFAPG